MSPAIIDAICVKKPTTIIVPAIISVSATIHKNNIAGLSPIVSKNLIFASLSEDNFNNPNLAKKKPAVILRMVGAKNPKASS